MYNRPTLTRICYTCIKGIFLGRTTSTRETRGSWRSTRPAGSQCRTKEISDDASVSKKRTLSDTAPAILQNQRNSQGANNLQRQERSPGAARSAHKPDDPAPQIVVQPLSNNHQRAGIERAVEQANKRIGDRIGSEGVDEGDEDAGANGEGGSGESVWPKRGGRQDEQEVDGRAVSESATEGGRHGSSERRGWVGSV